MQQFSEYTKKIIAALPYWFKMKKDSLDSTGVKFLNITGLELDDVNYILNYAYEQTRIDQIDLDFVDIVYKTILPDNMDSLQITIVKSNENTLLETNTLSQFFGIINTAFAYPELYGNHLYYLDQVRNILYVRFPYDKNNDNPDGTIQVIINNVVTTCSLSLYQVWNFFDEFGLLLDCPRIHGEPNREYKTRILDVFKNPGGAHKNGLMNGIARELGIRREAIWPDGSIDFVISDTMVIVNSITVNNILIDETSILISEQNELIIPGDVDSKNVIKSVSYITGMEMHLLHNKDDRKLQNELFNSDNSATELLKYYADRVHSEAPIMWNEFKWNESYWDISDKELGGIAFISNLHDASIKGFTKFDKRKLTNYTKT